MITLEVRDSNGNISAAESAMTARDLPSDDFLESLKISVRTAAAVMKAGQAPSQIVITVRK